MMIGLIVTILIIGIVAILIQRFAGWGWFRVPHFPVGGLSRLSILLPGIGAVAAAVVTAIVVAAFGWYFPETAHNYYAHGGPGYSLVMGAFVLGILGLIPTKGIRIVLMGFLGLVVGTAVLSNLVPALLLGPPCDPVCIAQRQAQAAQQAAQRAPAAQQPNTHYGERRPITIVVPGNNQPSELLEMRGECLQIPRATDIPVEWQTAGVFGFRASGWQPYSTPLPGHFEQIQFRTSAGGITIAGWMTPCNDPNFVRN
jgi:hypothetical protein